MIDFKVILLSLLIFISGCIPFFDHPLTDADKSKIDADIIGTWFWKDRNETGYIHIGLVQDTNLLKIILLEVDQNNKIKTTEFWGHTSSLAANKYLNLKSIHPENNISGYLIIKYQTSKFALTMSLMSTTKISKAVNDGLLKGELSDSGLMASVRISAEQRKLQDFILKNDATLFKETTCLQRLRLPAMEQSCKWY